MLSLDSGVYLSCSWSDTKWRSLLWSSVGSGGSQLCPVSRAALGADLLREALLPFLQVQRKAELPLPLPCLEFLTASTRPWH